MTKPLQHVLTRYAAQPVRQLSRWLIVVGAAAIVIACGGGVSTTAGVGSGGTGAAVNGPATGFGSVIVNGIRFDDSTAAVTLDDGIPATSDDLRLGMMLEIEGERDVGSAIGKADTIASSSFAQGPISLIDTSSGQLTVLGLVVTVTNSTVFEGASGLDDPALTAGAIVEVHGIPDEQGRLTATRIERKEIALADQLRLVGPVKDLNAQNKTFSLYGLTVRYRNAALTGLQNGISEGIVVRVKGSLLNASTIAANSVGARDFNSANKEGLHINLEGIITSFVFPSVFQVNGLNVNVVNPSINVTPVLGARVEVEGTIVNGTLLATKVEQRGNAQQTSNLIELHGPIVGLNTVAKNFRLRNTMVRWDANSVFEDGLIPEQLANDLSVVVKGRISGNMVTIGTIKREN
jgi:hypothetical protein